MAPPKKRQKTNNNTVTENESNTATSGFPTGNRPIRQRASRFSRPRQPNASANNNVIELDRNEQTVAGFSNVSQNEQSAIFNIDYAKLAAEIIRQQGLTQTVQTDTRDNVTINTLPSQNSTTGTDKVVNNSQSNTSSSYSASQNSTRDFCPINLQSHTTISHSTMQNSEQLESLVTENQIPTNPTSNSQDNQNTVLARLLPPLSTLPLTGEPTSSGHALNSSFVNNQLNCERSTVQPSSVQNNLHNLIDNLLTSQPVSTNTNSGIQSQFGRVTDLSVGIPLGAHVPQKTKEKIWADDYIDLRSLLSTEVDTDPWSITLAPSTIIMRSNQTNQNNSKKPPLSFLEWTEAFHIYMAIYVEKYPDESKHMLKYMSTVREIYALKNIYAVHYYDETFRLLRKTNHQPWQIPLRELKDNALYKKRPNQIQAQPARNNYNNRTNTNNQPFPAPHDGTCHIYNKYQSCNRKNCNFQHVCKLCRGPHPQITCPRSNKSQQNTANNKQTSKPQHTPQPGKN